MWKRRQNKDKIVKFFIRENFKGLEKPVKATKAFPEWFKKINRHAIKGNRETATVKTCIPFIDAMSLGYIVPLWADMRVIVEDELECYDENEELLVADNFPMVANVEMLNSFLDTRFKTLNDIVGMPLNGKKVHSVKKGKLNIFATFSERFGSGEMEGIKEDIGAIAAHPSWQVGGGIDKFTLGRSILKIHAPWVVRLPKGYSLYFKNPANHFEHDLELFEGLVDVDEYPLNINMPFCWRSEKKGDFILKAGTPLCQIIPIKREVWSEEYGIYKRQDYVSDQNVLNSRMFDRYKSIWWHKRKNNNDND